MSAAQIRRATSSDAALLAELGARTFSDTFLADNDPANVAAHLADTYGPDKQANELADIRVTYFVAEIAGTPVGYAMLKQGDAPRCIEGEAPLEIARLYVTKAELGRGVGASLMQRCIDEARRTGRRTLWLGVWERNTRAQAFYRRWGFETVGQHVFPVGADPQNDFVMSLSL